MVGKYSMHLASVTAFNNDGFSLRRVASTCVLNCYAGKFIHHKI